VSSCAKSEHPAIIEVGVAGRYDLLIRGATVVDGVEHDPRRAEHRLRGIPP
jgi:hypothetical protein